MPGLIGFTDRQNEYEIGMLSNMRDLLTYSDKYVKEDLYSDENIYASRTHLGLINFGKQPYCLHNRFCSWMEGEFYNQEELRLKYVSDSRNDNRLLLDLYARTMSFDFLRDIDGCYAAVIYDRVERKIHLITDRLGFKPLYWGKIKDNLVWSSELKGFLGHTDFMPVIDRAGVREFFDYGYLLENRTWFEGVELVPPSSVLSFDFRNANLQMEQYWAWSDIKPIEAPFDERELVRELGRLFKISVMKRVNEKERIGVSLSGGLDSRAILAAIPENGISLQTFTFGKKGCADIRIASQVSRVRGADHQIYYLDSTNWFEPRISGVWKTDGAVSLLNLHGSEFCQEFSNYIDIVLNGFAGDLVLGGSYLLKTNLDKKIDSCIVKEMTYSEISVKNFNEWYRICKTDPYFINNRVRRFTNSGLVLIGKVSERRIPFWDNRLIDFVYGLPDYLRYDSYIYKKMLLNTFQRYFIDIPWQKTSLPISYSERRVKYSKFNSRILRKIKDTVTRFGFTFDDKYPYTNYREWIREEPVRSFFKEILFSNNALYPDYIDSNTVHHYFNEHMEEKGDFHNQLCLALTFELWLQQVFAGRFRDSSLSHPDIFFATKCF
jgi:asparagine synthase (glutamine-hydrolysing)